MRLTRPFELVTPTADGEVLAVLAGADQWFTASRIQALSGQISLNGVRYALARLVSQGIVHRQVLGNQHSYHLNRDHLGAPAILELAQTGTRYLARLRSSFAEWPIEPAYAALFGSAARGDMERDSDIDLFLARPRVIEGEGPLRAEWDAHTQDLASLSTSWTGNDTRIFEMGEDEARRALVSADEVVIAVKNEGIVLVGNATFWKRPVHG